MGGNKNKEDETAETAGETPAPATAGVGGTVVVAQDGDKAIIDN